MLCAELPGGSGYPIETDEMWLQPQTDLKEAIESVWTVMGYPEHCRGARRNNEMHLFTPSPPHTAHANPLPGEASIDSAFALNLFGPDSSHIP